MSIHVRRARTGDAEVLARLNRACNGVEIDPQHMARRLVELHHHEAVVVAECVDAVAGFACVQITESLCYVQPVAELTELYVDEPYREAGIGATLAAAAVEVAQRAGASEIVVRVSAANDVAAGLFTRLGFSTLEHQILAKPLAE